MTVQAMAMEMTEKIDRESVGFIVHEKYEEIVRYLQDALQSSLEDENRFKQKADEIQEMVILLTNSKADRTEIQHMQELMVKSEALLKKVGGQMNIKEKLKDLVSRKDLEAILEMKVDKVDFEMQLQQVAANSKRNRKLTSMPTGPPTVDDAIDQIKPASMLNRKPVVGSGSQGNTARTSGRGGPETQRGEAIMHQQQALGEYDHFEDPAGDGYQSPFLPGERSPSGERGSAAELARQKNLGFSADISKTNQDVGRKYPGPGETPVMAIGRSMGNTSPGRGNTGEFATDAAGSVSKTGGRNAGGDFGSHVRGKTKNPVTSSSLPNTVPPGTFRTATEGGKAGGDRAHTPGGSKRTVTGAPKPVYVEGGPILTQQQWVAAGQDPGTYIQYLQQVESINPGLAAQMAAQLAQDPGSQQGSVPDHTSFMQGPVIGGGFNTHSKNLLHKMPGAKPVADEDLEGKGL